MSYGYNRHLSSKHESSLNNYAVLILNYEVTGSEMATSGNTITSVTGITRHLNGSNYSYADGHVRWSKPESVGNATANFATFAPR